MSHQLDSRFEKCTPGESMSCTLSSANADVLINRRRTSSLKQKTFLEIFFLSRYFDSCFISNKVEILFKT